MQRVLAPNTRERSASQEPFGRKIADFRRVSVPPNKRSSQIDQKGGICSSDQTEDRKLILSCERRSQEMFRRLLTLYSARLFLEITFAQSSGVGCSVWQARVGKPGRESRDRREGNEETAHGTGTETPHQQQQHEKTENQPRKTGRTIMAEPAGLFLCR